MLEIAICTKVECYKKYSLWTLDLALIIEINGSQVTEFSFIVFAYTSLYDASLIPVVTIIGSGYGLNFW